MALRAEQADVPLPLLVSLRPRVTTPASDHHADRQKAAADVLAQQRPDSGAESAAVLPEVQSLRETCVA